MITQCLKGFAAVALAFAASACGSNLNMSIGDTDGVPLADLDTSGPAPTRLVLAGPDNVVVSEGNALSISVTGDADAKDALRFNLDDGSLGIMRENGSKAKGKATVAITMPSAQEFVIAGSGAIKAPTMTDNAEINIAGSGSVAVDRMAASKLSVNVMGSGRLKTAGTADRLDFNVAGSGNLAARDLRVERAEVNIAGSGGGEFTSDGKVNANVAGSGDVTVYGRADCTISSVGSGRLNCRADNVRTGQAPAAPTPPSAPPAPTAPVATE